MQKSIVVIGDLMLDEYLSGEVERISQEAPIPIVHVQKREIRPGGAANVAMNLLDMGYRVQLRGVCGEDFVCGELIDILESKGIDASGVRKIPERCTTCKTRVVSRSQQMLRMDREDHKPVDAETSAALLEAIEVETTQALVIQDYGKGVITQGLLDAILEQKIHEQIPIFMDPNPNNILKLSGQVTHFKPNFSEALKLTHSTKFKIADENVLADHQVMALGEKLYQKTGSEFVVLTLGEHGIVAFERGKPIAYDPTRAREVYDVSGAGDTVLAALIHAQIKGMGWQESLHFANEAASIVLSKFGTATLGDEIQALL